MTEQLVHDPAAVAALSAQVAARTGIPLSHIEKDFWVTEVLRGVVGAANAGGIEIVFKGGTSLSKAFSLIERFSEDVDVLAILPAALGKGARDTILKSLVNGAATATGLAPVAVPSATSTGLKRGARFHYTEQSNTFGLTAGVFLEIGSRGGAMPASVMPIVSILARDAATELNGFAETEPVLVRVLDPCRTLVEKLVLLHTAHTADDSHDAIRGARHYYDVYQLLQHPKVLTDLETVGIETLSRDVCTYSTAAGLEANVRPTGGFANSPAFTNSAHLDVARDRYEQAVLQQLLWPNANRPSFDDCLNAVNGARKKL
jgi:Nucleotidyl transferase AbiEii toxin, Type IV TA system